MQTTSNFAGRAFAALSALVLTIATISGTVAVPGKAQAAHDRHALTGAAYIGDVA